MIVSFTVWKTDTLIEETSYPPVVEENIHEFELLPLKRNLIGRRKGEAEGKKTELEREGSGTDGKQMLAVKRSGGVVSRW